MQVAKNISNTVREMRSNAQARDAAMARIRQVREGNMHMISPGMFSEEWPKPVVANFIDVAAHDTAEIIAPLPSLNCASGAMRTDADKRKAAIKNKIGHHYWVESRLEVQMYYGADWYVTYGFLPIYVEADLDESYTPRLCVEDPYRCYYTLDRYGQTVRFARYWRDRASRLAAMFPENAGAIMNPRPGMSSALAPGDPELEIVRYCDEHTTTLYLPERGNLVLASYDNPLSRCPVAVAERPRLTDRTRGQYDDVVWVQLARDRLARLALELGYKTVGAPLVVPKDTVDLPIGPDAVMRTDGRVYRAPIDVPQDTFALSSEMSQEMQTAARYPQSRLGQIQASVITGRGVQALSAGFDSQIKSAQVVLGDALRRATSLAFEMDEKVYANRSRHINGTLAGETYSLTYTPGRDINGNYQCDVTYGFAAGLGPQQAIVTLLQLRGDGLISRDMVRRQLPFDIDVDKEQRDLDVQEAHDALKQGLFAYVQALGPLIQSGADPQQVLNSLATVIKGRRNGKPLEDLVIEAFKPPEPPPEAPGAAGPGAGPGGPPGVEPSGLPQGVAPGQAGQAPGGAPDIQTLIAGLRAGRTVSDATVSRRIPTG